MLQSPAARITVSTMVIVLALHVSATKDGLGTIAPILPAGKYMIVRDAESALALTSADVCLDLWLGLD